MLGIRPELSDSCLKILEIKSRAEADFYRACRDQLFGQYLTYHSIQTVRLSQRGAPRDGEADFVIFDPNNGFIVVEVKGGGISYNPENDEWHTYNARGRYSIKDPFRQAKEEKYAILEKIKKHPGWSTLGIQKILIGHAVFFPDLDNLKSLITPNSPREILGGREDLTNLKLWVARVINYWKGPVTRFQPLKKRGIQLIEDIFSKDIEVRPLVSADLHNEEIIRYRLTEQQANSINLLGERKRVTICGGAGTGKTLIAIHKAQELANNGLHVLLLCFNRALADRLKVVVGHNEKLWPMSFHQLCEWRIQVVKDKTGLDLLSKARADHPGKDKFDVHYPYAMAVSIDICPIHFDAIIVDEGQDFGEEYWLPVEFLLKDEKESCLFVFYDWNQAIYQRVSTYPIKAEPFTLTTNCRNTKHIHKAAYHFYEGVPTNPPEINGLPIELIQSPSIESQSKRLYALITNLLSIEKVLPSEIVVLVSGSPKRNYYNSLIHSKLPNGIDWSKELHRIPNTILIDTVKRFKGLEAAIVILWGIDDLDLPDDNEILYIAFSRAKSILYIIGNKNACHKALQLST